MDECANAHAKQYIGKNLFKSFHDLIFGENETVFLCQVRSCDVYASHLQRILYYIFQFTLQMQFLYNRSPNHSDDQTNDDVDDGNFRSEDAHQ